MMLSSSPTSALAMVWHSFGDSTIATKPAVIQYLTMMQHPALIKHPALKQNSAKICKFSANS